MSISTSQNIIPGIYLLSSQKIGGTHVRQGFTLMELLVVMTVIALLASLLIPVIGVIRSASHQQSCLNNQRQMVTSMLTYAADHRGILPPSSFSYWNRPYFPLMVATQHLADANPAKTNAARNVLECPADRRATPPQSTPNAGGAQMKNGIWSDEAEGFLWISTSYCFNNDAFQRGYYPDIEGHAIPAHLASNRGSTPFFWDSFQYAGSPAGGSIGGINLHGTGINISFCDGSARHYAIPPCPRGDIWAYVNWVGTNAMYYYWGPEGRRLIGPQAGAPWLDNLQGEPWM